jgi:hypothetical protein
MTQFFKTRSQIPKFYLWTFGPMLALLLIGALIPTRYLHDFLNSYYGYFALVLCVGYLCGFGYRIGQLRKQLNRDAPNQNGLKSHS